MKYTCPKCGKEIDISAQLLSEMHNCVTCPQCLSSLKIDGDYAYIPIEPDQQMLNPYTGKEPEPDNSFETTDAESNGLSAVTPPPFHPGATSQSAPLDPLYFDAVHYVSTCNAITTLMLQQYFNIPFERAELIMQQLEKNGIVGPDKDGRPRTILIEHDQALPYFTSRRRDNDPLSLLNGLPDDAKKYTYYSRISCGGCLMPIIIGLAVWLLFRLISG